MSEDKLIAIVDYGMGNIGSIRNMLRKVGAPAVIASAPADLERATKIILPGVGAFDQGMEKLESSGFRQALDRLVLEHKRPILGICLGMQLFTRASEEGRRPGLGWVPGETVRFQSERLPRGLHIPHMGWNAVMVRKTSPLFDGLTEEQRFYFLHSYHVVCTEQDDVLTETVHGYPFTSSYARGNIIGAQFHPEKSHRFGMEFLRRFAEAY